MSNLNEVKNYIKEVEYYINDIKDCLHKNTITVLMGRDKAFSGIYAQQVLNDFKGRILFSEKNPHNQTVKFLEIDLISKACQWY